MSIKNTQNNEEVDLGQLFRAIGNMFQQFFQFIGTVFKNLFLAFVWLVFFIKRRIIIFTVTALIGLALGIFLDTTSPPTYKSSISVKQNYETGENLYGSIVYYNGLIRDGDFKVLADVLAIDKGITKEIVEFNLIYHALKRKLELSILTASGSRLFLISQRGDLI